MRVSGRRVSEDAPENAPNPCRLPLPIGSQARKPQSVAFLPPRHGSPQFAGRRGGSRGGRSSGCTRARAPARAGRGAGARLAPLRVRQSVRLRIAPPLSIPRRCKRRDGIGPGHEGTRVFDPPLPRNSRTQKFCYTIGFHYWGRRDFDPPPPQPAAHRSPWRFALRGAPGRGHQFGRARPPGQPFTFTIHASHSPRTIGKPRSNAPARAKGRKDPPPSRPGQLVTSTTPLGETVQQSAFAPE